MFQIGIILEILFFMGFLVFLGVWGFTLQLLVWIYFIFVHVKEGMGAHVWVCSERENGLKTLSKETINQVPCEFSVF